MFDKILIANRGEIACRVAATARRMGIRTVAVYSDADAHALHVAACDEAYRLGPAPARESYLRGDLILDIAKKSGTKAIHPGYGFLSENEDFAAQCHAAGIAFIGPPPGAIAAMGSKSESKRLMGEAKVPLVPGYHGVDQQPSHLHREADAIGYPVLIKASAGGGGKGMRVVEQSDDFDAALASCRREAKASFGDDRVLIEKYLTKPRHVEIQVFADTLGNCIYLFERDCSVQRRHQKVLEEAPAPGMTPERRRAMGEAAVAAARAVGYVGAGTVEFIVDTLDKSAKRDAFYFMEMNTRLQVEHPVTEMITRQDLVEWQIRVASGERLPLLQDELTIDGHAIEARIYAEDPAKGFLPSVGSIRHLSAPAAIHFAFNPGVDPDAEPSPVRIDSGVQQGDAISQYYDPMIAKLIAWGHDRDEALRRLRGALASYQVAGVATNIEFLHTVAGHRAFAHADLDTGLIARHHDALIPSKPLDETALAVAALAEVERMKTDAAADAVRSNDPHSPWHVRNGWWLNHRVAIDVCFGHETGERMVHVTPRGDAYEVAIGRHRHAATIEASRRGVIVTLDGHRIHATVVADGEHRTVFIGASSTRLSHVGPWRPPAHEETGVGRLVAPMSGTIIAVNVKEGDSVDKGRALMILEAMKMEHAIAAPGEGIVERVFYKAGDQVKEGAELVSLKRPDGATAAAGAEAGADRRKHGGA